MGRTTHTTDAIGSVTTVYDALGRVSTITDSANRATVYAYDATSQLTRVTYANGKVTRYFNDSAGRATKTGAGANGDIDPTQYYYDGTVTKYRWDSGWNVLEEEDGIAITPLNARDGWHGTPKEG